MKPKKQQLLEKYAPSDEDWEQPVTILLVGGASVGKSSLLQRFMLKDKEQISMCIAPTIEETHEFTYQLSCVDKQVKLKIVDTAGDDSYKISQNPSDLVTQCEGCILVADVTDRSSLKDIKQWLLEINKRKRDSVSGIAAKRYPEKPLCIAGNKCDQIAREFTRDDVLDSFLKCMKPLQEDSEPQQPNRTAKHVYFETSAYSNTNVRELFESVIQQCIVTRVNRRKLMDNYMMCHSVSNRGSNKRNSSAITEAGLDHFPSVAVKGHRRTLSNPVNGSNARSSFRSIPTTPDTLAASTTTESDTSKRKSRKLKSLKSMFSKLLKLK